MNFKPFKNEEPNMKLELKSALFISHDQLRKVAFPNAKTDRISL